MCFCALSLNGGALRELCSSQASNRQPHKRQPCFFLCSFSFQRSHYYIDLYIGNNTATLAAKLKMRPYRKERWFYFTVKLISPTLSYPHTHKHQEVCIQEACQASDATKCAARCLSRIQTSSMMKGTRYANYQSSTFLLGPFLGDW